MHPAVLDRQDYHRMLCNSMPERYPKTTSEAAKEIVLRGGLVDDAILTDMAAKGLVTPAKRNGRRLWSPENIDAVLEHVGARVDLTPWGHAFVCMRVTAKEYLGELVKAHAQLRSEWGDLAGEEPNMYEFDWRVESNFPGRSTIAFTPSPATLARMQAALDRQTHGREQSERTADAAL